MPGKDSIVTEFHDEAENQHLKEEVGHPVNMKAQVGQIEAPPGAQLHVTGGDYVS